MIIEDKIIKRLNKREKINERLIYIVDIHIEIIKTTKIKKIKRNVILINELFESKPKKENEKYFIEQCELKCNLTEKEEMKIEKIVLIKELGCSIYG